MIFVTGATGLLGNCVVRELRSRGESVRAMCRSGTSAEPLVGLGAEIVDGDLANPEALADLIAGCKAVIHCGAYIHVGWQRLEQSRKINVVGTRAIAEICEQNGIRLVHISTVDTFPAAKNSQHPLSEDSSEGVPLLECSYVVSKREAEAAVLASASTAGLDAVVLNPGFMLGPFDWKPSSGRMMLVVNRSSLLMSPPGGCSVCDARDVAHAAVNALTMGTSGERYILGGENISYTQLWREILRASGRRKRIIPLRSGIKFGGLVIDQYNRLLTRPEGDLNGASIGLGCLKHYYDSSKAEAELGYVRRPLKTTLVDAWQWLKQHHESLVR